MRKLYTTLWTNSLEKRTIITQMNDKDKLVLATCQSMSKQLYSMFTNCLI